MPNCYRIGSRSRHHARQLVAVAAVLVAAISLSSSASAQSTSASYSGVKFLTEVPLLDCKGTPCIEVRIGEMSGMMNIGIPSIIVKMLRQKFDQQWSVRKTRATEEERGRVLRLIRPAIINLDARLQGPTLGVEALLDLKEGDILAFDYPLDRPLDVMVNGKLKYQGEIVSTGRKRGFQIQQLVVDETLKAAAGTA